MKNNRLIPFSRPYRSANELQNLAVVLESGHVHGDGPFTLASTAKLRSITGVQDILLTTSGSHALEMASLLLDIGPDDEVIMPSFTFPSAANAIALRGARIVFVDIDRVSGNIDADLVEKHITSKTKAISIVHYGGVAADMGRLLDISRSHSIPIIEDNAHGLGGRWKGEALGSLGVLAIQSFHDTKNIHSGEGGALLINDPALMGRAEMIREKGTNRSRFLRGQVDKYTWTEIGSSYLPSEINAAVLDSQLDEFEHIQVQRHAIWNRYARELEEWSAVEGVSLMQVPSDREHTAHVFFLLLPSHADQTAFIAHMREEAIVAVFHYVPLDTSHAGRQRGTSPDGCPVSRDFSERLVRLPLWAGMSQNDIDRVIAAARSFTVSR